MAPSRKNRKVAPNFSNEQKDAKIWRTLKRRSAYASFQKKNYTSLLASRTRRMKVKRSLFAQSFKLKKRSGPITGSKSDKVRRLHYWMTYNSWSFCEKCGLLAPRTLLPTSFNQKGVRPIKVKSCYCSKNKYPVPRYKKIPKVLRKLSEEDEGILRIFHIDIGPRKVAAMGHRIKNGAFELIIRQDTVEERIAQIQSCLRKQRLSEAYDFLIKSQKSAYSHFLKHQNADGGNHIKFWVVYKMTGIECALWPVLYPYLSWCESFLSGDKESILISFRIKLLSNITSYNNNFELLQYHYDRWIFKIVTGAVSSGKYRHCSPLKALENKHFTPGYWRWQSRYLADACVQYGPPKLFVTISPYEWDFPKSIWLLNFLQESGCVPTKSGAVETLHIAHVLEQILRGFFTGINSNQWERHVYRHLLYASKHSFPGNVECVFYRFEYQNRRTIHVHMLVWLKSLSEIDLQPFKATVPSHNIDDAFIVTNLQESNRPPPFLNICKETSATTDELHLEHNENDHKLNLRAFIDPILFSLQSRMDVQTSDGEAALMRYVTTYVTKLSENAEILRSVDSTSFQQAWPYLIDMFPGEPEMTMAFSGQRISHSNLTRVKIVPPTIEHLQNDSAFSKYLTRLKEDENQTMVEYCRNHCMSKPVPTLLVTSNLVGVHYKYIFNPRFFYEFTIMNTPFRKINDITDPSYDNLPDNLKHFSFFIYNHPGIEHQPSFLQCLGYFGYNENKIRIFQTVCRGFRLLYYKYCSIVSSSTVVSELKPLTMEQKAVFNDIVGKIETRSKNFQNPLSLSSSSS